MLRRLLAAALLAAAACNTVVDSIPPPSGSGGGGGTTASSSTASTTTTAGGAGGTGGAGMPDAGNGGDGGDAGPVDVAVALDAFCTSFAAWYCALAPSCGCEATSGWPGSVAACAKVVRAECLPELHWIQEHDAVFLPDRAAACLAGLQASGTAACVNVPGIPAPLGACSAALATTEPLGSPCTLSGVDCAGGDGSCIGTTCSPHPGLGQACGQGGTPGGCPAGDFCNAAGVCEGLGDVGTPCTADYACGVGLACNGNGLCATPLAAGHACAPADACGPGLTCTGGTCQPSPVTCHGDQAACGVAGVTDCRTEVVATCSPVVADGGDCGLGPALPCAPGLICWQSFAGGSCAPPPGAGQACPDHACQPGLGCNGSTCQPPAAQGQPCNAGPDTVQCAAGLACSDPGNGDGTCTPVSGPACASDADCTAPDRCADAGVCRAPAAVGDPCDAATPCASGALCVGGICRQLAGAGAACPDDLTACAPGMACVEGAQPGHGTCQAVPTGNQSCDIDGRCAAGFGCWQEGTFGGELCEPTFCRRSTFPD